MAIYTEKENKKRRDAVKKSKRKMLKDGFILVGLKVPANKKMLLKDFAKELCDKHEGATDDK
jgi:hypothetical protein